MKPERLFEEEEQDTSQFYLVRSEEK